MIEEVLVFVLGGRGGAGAVEAAAPSSALRELRLDPVTLLLFWLLILPLRGNLASLVGGGGGVPFLRDVLLLIPAMLAGINVGVCVRESVSGAETKEAVELVVPVRRGKGGGLSSL